MSDPHPSGRAPSAVWFWIWHAGLPLVLVLLGTALFRVTSLDLAMAGHFYSAQGARWPQGSQVPWQQLYDFGEIPGWVIFGGSLALLVVAWFRPSLRRWRLSAAFLALVMLVGPGLVTNSLLKEHWGRPRPRQIEEFGGRYRFEPVWMYDASSRGKSFPSGHASVAFFLMALYFVALYHRWPSRVRWGLLVAGLVFGFFMGVARMAQGGHFASDVLWAFAVVWLVACAGAAWILQLPGSLRDRQG